jgi:hypothetical protein
LTSRESQSNPNKYGFVCLTDGFRIERGRITVAKGERLGFKMSFFWR